MNPAKIWLIGLIASGLSWLGFWRVYRPINQNGPMSNTADGFSASCWNGIADKRNQPGGNISGYAIFQILNSRRIRLPWEGSATWARSGRKRNPLSIGTAFLLKIMPS